MSVYIKKLIQQGEHQQLDFKYAINDSKKIARSLVAFANTDGGILLIGVKDNGAIVGVSSEEEYFMVEAAASLYSRPQVPFNSRKWIVNGKIVLEIEIPKSTDRPHYSEEKDKRWKVYIRVKDQNLLANSVLLDVWKKESQKSGVYLKYTDKEKILLHFLQDNNTITISKFCRIARVSNYKARTILVNLILLDIIEIRFTDKKTYYTLKEGYKERLDSNKIIRENE